MLQKPLDEKLILRIAEKDADAFRQVYEETGSAVYGLALSILRNRHDAEDVMHDTFIRIYQNSGAYTPQGKPLAWILTITKNLCYNMIRSRKAFDEFESLPDTEDKRTQIENSVINRSLIRTAMQILDDEEREIITLHAMAGWKHRETAEFLNMPLATVITKYNRGLKKMRKELEGKETVS